MRAIRNVIIKCIFQGFFKAERKSSYVQTPSVCPERQN
jgi:hypothetical protein